MHKEWRGFLGTVPYTSEDGLSRVIDGIEDPHNRQRVQDFLDEQRANGIKLATLLNLSNHLRHWANFLGARPFTEATRKEVVAFCNIRHTERTWRPGGRPADAPPIVRTVPLSNATLNMRKATLKQFQRWARGGGKKDPYPDEVKWLEQKRSADDDLPTEQILTPEELRRMIEASSHLHDQAVLHVLYDSGMRASEFCSLRIRDVVFDENGAILALSKEAADLKTGARRVRIISSAVLLRQWINKHPQRDNPDAPLWHARSNRNQSGDRLKANGLGYVLEVAAKRAKLDKDIWPHLFRISRATLAAKEGWPESVMRAHFGWARSSTMPSHYIRLAGKDADDFILQAAGIKPKDRKATMAALAAKTCAAGHLNPAGGEYCETSGCGRALTPEAAQRQQAAQLEIATETLARSLLSNPAFQEQLAKTVLRKRVSAGSKTPR